MSFKTTLRVSLILSLTIQGTVILILVTAVSAKKDVHLLGRVYYVDIWYVSRQLYCWDPFQLQMRFS